jgi:hypothetical protein
MERADVLNPKKLFFITAFLFLCTACSGNDGNSPPTTVPLPLLYTVSDIICEGEFVDAPNVYPGDNLVIGESTKSDVEALFGPPQEERESGLMTFWQYSNQPPAYFWFQDGLLESHEAARTQLGEIIAYYGPPAAVVWQIPKIDYHGASKYTFLIYSETGAIFYNFEQTVTFTPETTFNISHIVSEANYYSLLSNYISEEDTKFDRYIHFAWPCAVPTTLTNDS